MGDRSAIEWTEATWNPVVGCSVVSPGCTNCYAMKQAHRLLDKPGSHYEGTTTKVKRSAVWTGKLAIAPDHILTAPLRRRRPTTYFVNSMGDLFHEDVPEHWIYVALAVMGLTYDVAGTDENHVITAYRQRHTYQVLTKRPHVMRRIMQDLHETARTSCIETMWKHPFTGATQSVSRSLGHLAWMNAPLSTWQWVSDGCPGLWLGVSAEDQRRAEERIPHLLNTPAAVRFVSCEPLLGPIDLTRIAERDAAERAAAKPGDTITGWEIDVLTGDAYDDVNGSLTGEYRQTYGGARLDWVIAGGESGPDARPMHPAWARSLRDQCRSAEVPFFFKQWGAWVPASDRPDARRGIVVDPDGRWHLNPDDASAEAVAMVPVARKHDHRTLDGQCHEAFPEVRP